MVIVTFQVVEEIQQHYDQPKVRSHSVPCTMLKVILYAFQFTLTQHNKFNHSVLYMVCFC